MRKFDFFLLYFSMFFACQNITAQLFVSNNYVYVADKYLYVKQDVNLQAAGNIYLRNESQLLQATTGNSTNQGVGELSVFQEGTSSNYGYNYWCSPVGIAAAGTGNTNFGITNLFRPTGVTLISSSPATILAYPALDGSTTSSSLSVAERWIYRYLSSTTYSQWLYTGSTAAIAAGQGFTMKGVSGTDATTVIGVQNNPGNKQRYDFRGKPNDGTIDVSVIGTAGNMTLAGNPYPSAIDLNLFLTDVSNTPFIDGTALFWEHNPSIASHFLANYQGGYGVYNGTTSVYTPAVYYAYDAAGNQTGTASTPMNMYERRFCPVGQGFMLRGTAPGNVQFKNSYRVFKNEGVSNNSEFHRLSHPDLVGDYGYYNEIPNVAGTDYTMISKAPTPHININGLLNNQAVRQVALCFMPNALDGVDLADSKSPDAISNLPFDMYLYLGNTEYVNSTTSFDINKKYPLGFKNNVPATFKIKVADFINFEELNVYLFDKQSDTYHDIKNSEYELTLPAGVNNSRFEVTFTNAFLGLTSLDADTFDIVQNNNTQKISISNPKLMDLKSVSLYDMGGKLIFSKTALGSKNTYQFSTSGLSDAVYIVKIVTSTDEDFGRKITVHNGK